MNELAGKLKVLGSKIEAMLARLYSQKQEIQELKTKQQTLQDRVANLERELKVSKDRVIELESKTAALQGEHQEFGAGVDELVRHLAEDSEVRVVASVSAETTGSSSQTEAGSLSDSPKPQNTGSPTEANTLLDSVMSGDPGNEPPLTSTNDDLNSADQPSQTQSEKDDVQSDTTNAHHEGAAEIENNDELGRFWSDNPAKNH